MKGKILVIEDNIFWHKKLEKYLIDAGFFVEIANNLEMALNKIKNERFHFITVDMQLNESTMDQHKFEGSNILKLIEKLHIQDHTPVMVITGFEADFNEITRQKKLKNIFFIGKGEFDRTKFISIIEKEIKPINLRFKNDFRGD